MTNFFFQFFWPKILELSSIPFFVKYPIPNLSFSFIFKITSESVVQNTTIFCLDCSNSFLPGLPASALIPIPLILHLAAREFL